MSAAYHGVVQVVTGGGKTTFAQLCMDALRRTEPDLRFTIIVPTQALLDQWYVALLEDLGLTESDIGLFSGRGKSNARLVNLMVVNTARTYAPRLAAAHPCMLVVDECHHVGSESNALALAGPYRATLGMSATPEREFDEGFVERIAPALGTVVYRYDLNQAREDGVVSPFDLVNVRIDLLPAERKNYDNLTMRIARAISQAPKGNGSAKERVEALLRKRARVSARAALRGPVSIRLIERHRGSRSIIFHEDIEQAEVIFKNLLSRSHSATIYHSRVAAPIRRDNLRLFRKGVFDVLVSCRALDEGVNVPETEVAVIASATASTRQRIQRLGRVLRPAAGKDRARIYSLFATKPEETRLTDEAAGLTAASSITWERVSIRREGGTHG